MLCTIEFPPLVKLADLQHQYTREDLICATEDVIDEMLALVEGVPDSYVTFLPDDADAHDPWAEREHEIHMPWTLGHVIVHTTASAEERASHGSMLARGTQIKGRNRHEVPWQTMISTEQVVHRLEESRRMRLAFLDTWPDDPHLDNIYDQRSYLEQYGPMNAIGITLLGLKHDSEHVPQIADIIRQARMVFR